MLTTKLNNKTFLINGVSYKVGDTIKLTTDEQNILERICALNLQLNTNRPSLYDRCHTVDSDYDEALAKDFYALEQGSREWQYLIGTLLHTVCTRVGGLLPLRINAEGDGSVTVREITNESEAVVITPEIVRRTSKFDAAVGDMRLVLASLVGGVSTESFSKLKVRSANWPLMGAPYVSTQTQHLLFPFEAADSFKVFRWNMDDGMGFEGSAVDRCLNNALQAALNADKRIDAIRNGSWPFTSMAILVGPKETLALNTSDLPSDNSRLNLVQREATRVGAKYLFIMHFGQINKEGSTHDYDNDETKMMPPIGFTVSMSMVSADAEKILMGGKAFRLTQGPQGASLVICASYEDHPGIGGIDGERMISFIFQNVNKPKLALVK